MHECKSEFYAVEISCDIAVDFKYRTHLNVTSFFKARLSLFKE